jgi:hypothetical protein
MLAVALAAMVFRAVSALAARFAASHATDAGETSFGIAPAIAHAVDRRIGPWLPPSASASSAVAWLAFAGAMVMLLRLARLDLDDEPAEGAVLLAAVYPFAFVFGRSSADALFFASAIAAFYGFRQQRWIVGGVCGAVATAALPTGILILPALAWIGLRDSSARRAWVAAALLLAVSGVGACLVYAYYRGGPPGGWIVAVREWGFHFVQAPWVPLQRLFTSPLPAAERMSGVAALTAIAAVPLVAWRLNGGYAIYMLAMLWLPLTSGKYQAPGEAVALLFPLFILIASIRSRVVVVVLAITSAMFYAIGLTL